MQHQKKILKDALTRKGVDEAAHYVANGWFPVNPEAIKIFLQRLREGVYAQNRDALFNDIKNDHGLFSFLLRRIGVVVEDEEKSKSPDELIRSLEIERLIKAFEEVTPETMSTHRFDGSSKAQALRLRHTLVSSTAAEVMADRLALNTEQAFMTASVRQLGLNLIAWNYPRIYSKALDSLSIDENDLDAILLRTLGYSPLQLGVKVALGWNSNIDTKGALGLNENASASAKQILSCCETGEAIAKINDPAHYPGAASKAADTIAEIEKVLGAQGLSSINRKLKTNALMYQELSSNFFSFEVAVQDSVKEVNSKVGHKLLEQNIFITKCPLELSDEFRKVYESIEVGSVSSTALNILVGEVIPHLGFIRGCVYLIDARGTHIVPMLRIGDSPLTRYRPLPCNSGSSHPVVASLSYSAPIIQENVFLNGDQVSHVTGTFGNKDKTGVLYLEMTPNLSEADRQKPLIFFKAIRECFKDCLNLR